MTRTRSRQVFIKIHIVGRQEVQRPWGRGAGATTVMMPTRVLNRFAAQGVRNVDFYGTQIPGKRALDAPSLPYPADDR